MMPEDLKAENEKLREKVQRQANEITHMRLALERANPDIRNWKTQCDRLAAENGRMHDLVWLLHRCAKSGGCEPCGYADGCDITDEMRKYGIEVK